mmetsp:Transcript_19752/g.53708  ORF Transcript_19752/g.53708 Transcript_19752/m.53708 type:complete len:248 (-) Transcript_19752:175-918(-)
MGCMVLPGLTGLLVQLILGVVCVSVLLLKWLVETWRDKLAHRVPRAFWTFCLDGSKQLAGAAWLHVSNLAFADVLTRFVGGGDECEWYWINIVIDTTFGCVVSWAMLMAINHTLKRVLGPQDSKEWTTSGHYYVDGHFKWHMFLKQAFIYVVLVVTLMKTVMVCIMVLFHNYFLDIASVVLHPFLDNDLTKLLVVMIITPTFMNAFQFCIMDSIIKLNVKLHSGLPVPLVSDHSGTRQQGSQPAEDV